MNRFSRVSTVWRKEFADTLRDRRTLIAMVAVPMVLYPALMLGSLQAFELQVGRLKQEVYTIAVESDEVRDWLQTRVIAPDPARHPGAAGLAAEDIPTALETTEPEGGVAHLQPGKESSAAETAQSDVRHRPPSYRVHVFRDVKRAVVDGRAHVGVRVSGPSLPLPDSPGSAQIEVLMDQTEIRSQIGAAGLEGIFTRFNDRVVERRLKDAKLSLDFVRPIVVEETQVASPEKLGGSVLGQIVPLILIIMTITGAIYPAIDLTAGERERGTLETLMTAPVPKVDLIAGKFVVVASIGMLSAVLNLLSIGGTIYLGGLGEVFTRGGAISIPLHTLPLVLIVLIPLAIMFSAMLLAVCSFARSFKEAQNYVMPVMIAALIPAVVGVLPGTVLQGPLLIVPVTNIVILTRELFMGKIDHVAILWVTLSTCLYAGAAVAVAAKLFGQEAVLFADSASVRVLFQRRFFKPARVPSASQALLLLAVIYSLNFFVQQSLTRSATLRGGPQFFYAVAAVLIALLALVPMVYARYLRVRVDTAFALAAPAPRGLLAGLCFGLSTWILAGEWYAFQRTWLPMSPELEAEFTRVLSWLDPAGALTVVLLLAVVPALCEELFFRGFVLSGLRSAFGRWGAVLLVAVAFGVYHQSVHRLLITAMLGTLFGLLVIRWGSLWPAVLAHLLHNGITLLSERRDGLQPLLDWLGYPTGDVAAASPWPWVLAAGGLLMCGLLLCLGPRPAAGGAELLSTARMARGSTSTPSAEPGRYAGRQ